MTIHSKQAFTMRPLTATVFVIGCVLVPGCSNHVVTSVEPSLALRDQVESLREEASIPALVLAEFTCETREIASAGVLRNDHDQKVSPAARFNIGSNAKSMLATVAARLDEKGKLDLDASLETLWPEAAVTHPDKSRITLAQLLSHTSGLPAFDEGTVLDTVPEFNGRTGSVTHQTALWFLSQPLVATPGQTNLYSNAGYVVAGAILEQVTGQLFNEIMRQELFVPLALDAAFGEPRKLGEDEPFGHYVSEGSVVVYDQIEPPIPAFLEAAGNVSLSMDDYIDYMQAHLCGLQGNDTELLSADMATRLHKPHIEGSAGLGWGLTELGGIATSFHIGGTGDFTAYMALSPDKNRGAAALLNVGGAPANPVQDWLVETMSRP